MGDGNGQNDFTLGTVVGELRGIKEQLGLLRGDVAKQGEDIKALQKSNSNIRWLERIGTVLGGVIGGFVSGRTGVQ